MTIELIGMIGVSGTQDGRVLVWIGGTAVPTTSGAAPAVATLTPLPDAERRQLTVLFCDLVDSYRGGGGWTPQRGMGVGRQHGR